MTYKNDEDWLSLLNSYGVDTNSAKRNGDRIAFAALSLLFVVQGDLKKYTEQNTNQHITLANDISVLRQEVSNNAANANTAKGWISLGAASFILLALLTILHIFPNELKLVINWFKSLPIEAQIGVVALVTSCIGWVIPKDTIIKYINWILPRKKE